jgi:hypothetical protein
MSEISVNDNWIVILGERGYAGSRKEDIDTGFNQKFGADNWEKVWFVDGKVESKEAILKYYEDGYFHFLKDNPSVLEWLVNTASEVYDIDPSNVNSGLDYSVQECSATHLQDIAVRRVLKRLEKEFLGDHLVQIRGKDSKGYVLNPGQVPFHKPELIVGEYKPTWWKENSVEDFYQRNKALLVNPNSLFVTPVIETPNGNMIYGYDKKVHYLSTENLDVLQMIKGRSARRLVHEDKRYKELHGKEVQPYSHFIQNTS